MLTLLVIDDDPLIADIIQALDPSWQVVAALDGLMGLDILRRRIADDHPPDLIVLDIHMPAFDGYDTCILIRAIAPTVPIIPFTQSRDDDRLPRYMQELHCTVPVLKGIALDTLRLHLRAAVQRAPATTRAPSAVFERLLFKAVEAERAARTRHVSHISIVLFAQSVVQRLGMKQVLEMVSDPPLEITLIDDPAATIALFAPERPILVASTSDAQHAFDLHQRHTWPLLLIAHTFQDGVQVARMIHDLPPVLARGVVLADHTLMRQIPCALRLLAAGKPYIEPLLCSENARVISMFSAEQHLVPELSAQLIRLVVLDFFGWTTATISDHFQVAPMTIETYWSRVAERLGRNREEARVWVKQCLERQPVVDQVREYLASARA